MSHPFGRADEIPPQRPAVTNSSDWWFKVPEVEPIEQKPRDIPEVQPVWPIPSLPTAWPAAGWTAENTASGVDVCWHCGQVVHPYDGYCRWCGVGIRSVPEVVPVKTMTELTPGRGTWGPLIKVAIGYVLVLAVIVGSAMWFFFRLQALGLDLRPGSFVRQDFRRLAELAVQQLTMAAIGSSLIVLVTWAVVGSLRPLPQPKPAYRLLAWFLGPFFILPVLLVINVVYSMVVRQLAAENDFEIRLMEQLVNVPWFWVLVTIQPAIFEELLFRFLMLGAFCDAFRSAGEELAKHLSVFLASLFFAIAHVGQPLYLPYLFLVGLVLGYLRLASGGLALPMLIHFLHNAAALVLFQLAQ
ncbi:MAG: CPBP family glutamic-type intramembrane protease [Gemmatales bacterium]|nr:CPBP family glutamic-type intramembrane protease [Gemmatales bacterium]MDW8223899.1 CPBP family glutamic-type intramembrane protease [Gemmatales bacterium]